MEEQDEKTVIRRRMLSKRSRLEPLKIRQSAEALWQELDRLVARCGFRRILAYSEVRKEIPVLEWIRRRLDTGDLEFFLPAVDRSRKGYMEFYRITSAADLVKGAYGILEPDPARCPAIGSGEKDGLLVLVPGCAFDKGGGRMGYGEGYYDRYLGGLDGCFKAGVCYHWQILSRVPRNQWDVKMDCIISDGGIFYVQ